MRLGILVALLALLAGGLAGAAGSAARGGAQAARPNFLVFIADDLAWNDLGAYGHPRVRTPNLDRLAREGLRFDRAFLTTSSCSPSRASILTGRYPHATGAPELHMPLPAAQRLLTTPLREAGYFTGAAGKWHLGAAVKSQLDVVREGGGPGGSEGWLPLLRERPRDRPFFLWLAATDPHRPYPEAGAPRVHGPEDAVVPPFLPDTPEVRADLARCYDEIARFDGAVGAALAELERQGAARDTLVLVLSDNGRPFPRCKTTLTDDGIRAPLLARWPGHARPGGTRAPGHARRAPGTCGALVSAVDLAPTLLELAGAPRPESFQGRSFAALLTDPAGQGREYAFAEHHWHDYRAYERAVRDRRYTYLRNFQPQLPATPPADAVNSPTFAAMRRLRDAGALTPAQRSVFTAPRPAEELYDLEQDPHSLKNLATDSAHADTLRRLRGVLDRWREETGDRFDPESLTPDAFDRETGARLLPAGQARPIRKNP